MSEVDMQGFWEQVLKSQEADLYDASDDYEELPPRVETPSLWERFINLLHTKLW